MQVARFVLDSAVLPPVTDTLRIAEAARIALMSRYGWITREGDVKGRSAIFSGKDADGKPLENHTHAYLLPTDENGDGTLDHLTVFAASGFGPNELRAIDSLREIKTKDTEGSGHPLGVMLTGLGCLHEFAPGPLRSSTAWQSATPFVCPEHPKTRGSLFNTERGAANPHQFLLYQVRKELARWLERNNLIIDAESVTVDLTLDSDRNIRLPDLRTGEANGLRPIQFRRFRQKRSDDGGQRLAGFFRLTFPHPVSGPVALGHSSHFGLGLFVPV